MDPKPIGELHDRGAGRSMLDEIVNLRGSEAGLLLTHSSATLRSAGAALSSIRRGRNAVTWGFRV